MNGNLLVIVAVLAMTVAAMIVANRLGAPKGAPPEVRRKLVHVVAGVMSLPFPWILSGVEPVLLLCALSLGLIAGVRFVPQLRRLLGPSLYATGRDSVGDLLFPISITGLFLLSAGEPVFFVVPVAVMTLADGAAALVGLRYGLSVYPTADGGKSWEGTIAFFAMAAFGTLVPLLLFTDVGRAEVLLLILLVGVIGCAIEASSWYGLDNVLVPFGTHYLLRTHLHRPAAELLRELAVIAIVSAVLVLWSRRTLLDTQGRFSALLAGYFYWILGGSAWLTPGVAVFVVGSLVVPVPEAARQPAHLWAILSVAASGLPWLMALLIGLLAFPDAFFAFCMTFVVQLCLSAIVRHRMISDALVTLREALEWSFLAAGALAIAFFLHVPDYRAAMLFVALGMAAATSVVLLWDRWGPAGPIRRSWAFEIAISVGLGWLSLVGLQLVERML